jgi:hypothetical protein
MRSAAAALLALAVATASAGDPQAPAQDSIAAAKKDFAQLKASSALPEGASALPSLDMKEMGPLPGSAPAAPTPLPTDKEASLDPSKRRTGTGNWLVDAMDKEERKSERGKSPLLGEDALKAENDLLAESERNAASSAKDGQGTEAPEKADSKETAREAYNPLTSFMGSWVSARDHELLLPSAKGETVIEGDGTRSRVDALPGLDLGGPSASSDSALSPPDTGGFSDSRPASNPYLALLDFGPSPAFKAFTSPEIPGFEAPAGQEVPRGLPMSGVDPRPLDASRTFIPDFAQPPDDDKYFKQMKRF